jgi:hypothetical protein
VRFSLLVVGLAASALCTARAQEDPFQGAIRLSVSEPLGARKVSRVTVTLATVGEYRCANYNIVTRQSRIADTVVIALLRVSSDGWCTTAFGPAGGRIALPLGVGAHTLLLQRGETMDRVAVIVTPMRLMLRPVGTLAFIQLDTTVFRRPAARSFLVSCGTADVPELCEDFGRWLARQPGIVRRPLAPGERIAFSRQGGYWHNDYQLFGYTFNGALSSVRRCMRQMADTLRETVGAGVTLQTAEGEVLHAWSQRSNHEPHIPIPHKVSGSPGCPRM